MSTSAERLHRFHAREPERPKTQDIGQCEFEIVRDIGQENGFALIVKFPARVGAMDFDELMRTEKSKVTQALKRLPGSPLMPFNSIDITNAMPHIDGKRHTTWYCYCAIKG